MQNKLFAHIYFGAVDPYKEDVQIQIFKSITMNQQQLVEQVFQTLLNQGPTTTLDVKNKLRQDYPDLVWDQNFVSTCCREYQEESDYSNFIDFTNNGTYREYYLIVPTQSAKEYSYTTADGVTIKANNWYNVLETAAKLGHKIHWSQTKQQFYSIDQMESHHILNTIKLHLEESRPNPEEFATFVQTSPYVKELVKRFPQ